MILEDCCAATDAGNHAAAIKMVKMQNGVFGAVSTSEALIKGLSQYLDPEQQKCRATAHVSLDAVSAPQRCHSTPGLSSSGSTSSSAPSYGFGQRVDDRAARDDARQLLGGNGVPGKSTLV